MPIARLRNVIILQNAVPPSQFGINELVPTFRIPQPQAQAKTSFIEKTKREIARTKYFFIGKNYYMFQQGRHDLQRDLIKD